MLHAQAVLNLTAEQRIKLGSAGIYDQMKSGGMIMATIQLDGSIRVAFVPLEIAKQIIEFAVQATNEIDQSQSE